MTLKHSEILKSDKTAVSRIEPVLAELKKSFNVSDDRFYNIMIAVSEAVNNAVNHGNQFDPDKKVHFDLNAYDDRVVISVRDEGRGFDPEGVADCTDPENLLKSNGRGVYLIRELMHDVEFDVTNGTKVTMTFFLK